MRPTSILSVLVPCLAACGGGSSSTTPDAPDDVGFTKPTKSLKANNEVSKNSWTELGPANLTCLNTPSADIPTSVAVSLSTVVRDFQSDNLVPGAMIKVFKGQDQSMMLDTQTADGNAAVTFTIPTNITRFGYIMTSPDSLDTLLLNQKVKPDMATQTNAAIKTVSKSTAQTLPALIGISRTPGTGVLAGAIRDCDDNEISNFIATVNTTSGVGGTFQEAVSGRVTGADSYYFSSSVGLPVRHTQKSAGSEDGLFMVVELQPAPDAFVQIWGYVDDAALAADDIKLIAELHTQSVADTVITGSYEPHRSN